MYTVLICDDDKAILDSLEIYLHLEGYEVIKAENGEEALKAAQLLLERNIDHHVGDVNQQVWQELVSSLIDFARECKVRGKLQGLNDMPASQWELFTTTILSNMQKMVFSRRFVESRESPMCP